MDKIKIYLDTSVISHLLADDTPLKKEETLLLWDEFSNNKNSYDILISTITLSELNDCKDNELKEAFKELLLKIDYVIIEENEEMADLADKYLNLGLLSQKSIDDCHHIAVASVSACDCILSWNFKHFVKPRTIIMVAEINRLLGYKQVEILSPTMFLEGNDFND